MVALLVFMIATLDKGPFGDNVIKNPARYIQYQLTAMKHTYQLRGMASTLRMRQPYHPGRGFQLVLLDIYSYFDISRKVVGKNVLATIPKGNMGYDLFLTTVAVEPTFVACL